MLGVKSRSTKTERRHLCPGRATHKEQLASFYPSPLGAVFLARALPRPEFRSSQKNT